MNPFIKRGQTLDQSNRRVGRVHRGEVWRGSSQQKTITQRYNDKMAIWARTNDKCEKGKR